jgi:hypothetical protein
MKNLKKPARGFWGWFFGTGGGGSGGGSMG